MIDAMGEFLESIRYWEVENIDYPNHVRMDERQASLLWLEVRDQISEEMRKAAEEDEGHPLDGCELWGVVVTVAPGPTMLSRRSVGTQSVPDSLKDAEFGA